MSLGLEPGSVTAIYFLVLAAWCLRVERGGSTRPLVSRTVHWTASCLWSTTTHPGPRRQPEQPGSATARVHSYKSSFRLIPRVSVGVAGEVWGG